MIRMKGDYYILEQRFALLPRKTVDRGWVWLTDYYRYSAPVDNDYYVYMNYCDPIEAYEAFNPRAPR